MRNSLVLSIAGLVGALVFPLALRAQTAPSKPADLSGTWALDSTRGGIGQSVSFSDPGGKLRGKEPDIPYQPWSLQKTLSEKPPTGPDSQFQGTTDPWINYCEPPWAKSVIYMEPGRTKFVQTADAVYILHEVMQTFRIVRLNSKHLDDPDPTWWGDSIGWYENGDTLVVDTIGTNDKTWLDQLGHPHTDKMHFWSSVTSGWMRIEWSLTRPSTIRGRTPSPSTHTETLRYPKWRLWQIPGVCSVPREHNLLR